MKITRYTSVEGAGPLTAFVCLYIEEWGLTLNDCRLVRTSKGGHFLAAPSRRYETPEGEKYLPYWTWDKSVNERFQKSVRAAIKEYIAQKSEHPNV